MVDGISIYPAVWQMHYDGHKNGTRAGPPFTIANCWAHARRNFIKAEVDFPVAGEMVALVGKLYRIVQVAEEQKLPDRERNYWVDGALAIIRNWLLTTRPEGLPLAGAAPTQKRPEKGLSPPRNA